MPVLSTQLPPIPFDGYSDCVLLYCPNIDSYRVVLGDASENTYLRPSASYNYSQYYWSGCYVNGFGDGLSYVLDDGHWVLDGFNARSAQIFYKVEDILEETTYGGIPISATFEVVMNTNLTPYSELGESLLLNCSYIDLRHENLTVMDSVLSGERMTSPILLEIYGLLPVAIVLIVGFASIRKGIAFLKTKLKGA